MTLTRRGRSGVRRRLDPPCGLGDRQARAAAAVVAADDDADASIDHALAAGASHLHGLGAYVASPGLLLHEGAQWSGRASGQDLVLQPELVGASMEKRGIGSDGEPSPQENGDGESLGGQEIEVAADPQREHDGNDDTRVEQPHAFGQIMQRGADSIAHVGVEAFQPAGEGGGASAGEHRTAEPVVPRTRGERLASGQFLGDGLGRFAGLPVEEEPVVDDYRHVDAWLFVSEIRIVGRDLGDGVAVTAVTEPIGDHLDGFRRDGRLERVAGHLRRPLTVLGGA